MPKKASSDIPFIIDTHVWLWVMDGTFQKKFRRANKVFLTALQEDRIFLSTISLWEVAMLEAKKRIELPAECLPWLHKALSAPGINPEEISPDIAVLSTRLPGTPPSDPADRIILATTICLGGVLVSKDDEMSAYADQHAIPHL